MKNIHLPTVLTFMVLVSLVGCGELSPVPTPVTPTPTPTLTIAPVPPVYPEPDVTPEAKTGLENTDAAGLGKTIENYNTQVDESNDKARGIIDDYNKQIESSTGK